MNVQRLTEIKERITALGDNGNWEAVHSEDDNQSVVEADSYVVGIEMAPEDAEFIAHARHDVPDLVMEVERLREALRQILNYEWTALEGHTTVSYDIARDALRSDDNS